MSLNLSPVSNNSSPVSNVLDISNASSPILPKPTINIPENNDSYSRPRLAVPPGTFTNNPKRRPLTSRQFGNAPFFINAKPASMLERGWIRADSDPILPGTKGLYTIKDGPEFEVTVEEPDKKKMYKFKADEDGTVIRPVIDDRYEDWDFYVKTKPVPFVPRKGGRKSRKARKSKKSKKSRRA